MDQDHAVRRQTETLSPVATMRSPYPAGSDVFIAACVAPFAASIPVMAVSFLFALFEGSADSFAAVAIFGLYSLVIAAVHMLVVGLPVYLLYRRWFTLTWWGAMLAGFLVGSLPGQLLFGEWGSWTMAVILGIPGAIGGLAFWYVLHRSSRARREADLFT